MVIPGELWYELLMVRRLRLGGELKSAKLVWPVELTRSRAFRLLIAAGEFAGIEFVSNADDGADFAPSVHGSGTA